MPTQPLVKLYDLKNGKNMGELKIGSKNRVNSYLSDGDGVMAANDSVIIVAYHYKKQIDIYDVSTLKLKKRLIGDYRPQKLTDDFTENAEIKMPKKIVIFWSLSIMMEILLLNINSMI